MRGHSLELPLHVVHPRQQEPDVAGHEHVADEDAEADRSVGVPAGRTCHQAPDADGAKALIAHLAGINAGHFTRIDIDFASGLAEWLESIGLLRVDAPTTMVRGAPLAVPPGGPSLFAIVTQAVG